MKEKGDMKNKAGSYLKALRLSRGYGLRQFAEMIDELPSNLSAMEHGRRRLPASPEKLRLMADTLALSEGSTEWEQFFFLARQPGQLPADLQDFAELELFPVVCRTLNELRPTEKELKLLVEMLKRRRRREASKDDPD
jgi:transcriptional regulator with XRE-family HTH domain